MSVGDIQAEIESIQQVASGMTGGAINTATQLKAVMDQLDSFAATSDWSTVPSCQAFGASYTAAIKTYRQAAQDMLDDATKMQGVLQKIAANYHEAEQRSADAFSKHMAALGSQDFMTQNSADQTYLDHRGDLHSDHPEAPEHQDADTGTNVTTAPTTPAPTTTGNGRVRMG